MSGRRLCLAAGVGGLLLAGLPTATATASADSFTPVALTIKIAGVARLHKPLAISVAVSADAGVLDTRVAPLRMQVKLSSECGVFGYTQGPVLLNKPLKPQPTTGQPYSGAVRGSGRPTAYGVQTVCASLDEQGTGRVFASDQSVQVNVSKPCTVDAARYDRSRKALVRAVHSGHHVARAHRTAASRRRTALKACGRGVPL